MGSIENAVEEDPGRFTKDIDMRKVKKAKNPQQQFLRELEKKLNNKKGLRIWENIKKDKNLIDNLFKLKNINPLDEEQFDSYIKKSDEKRNRYQIKIEEEIKRKKEKGDKIMKHRYNDVQIEFIKANRSVPVYELATSFNKAFRTKLTRYAIRDKRLRLIGKKK